MRSLVEKLCLFWALAVLFAPVGAQTSTALLQASRAGNIAAVKESLGAGTDPNSADSSGISALMMAAAEGHVDAVKALIEAGADINHQSEDGWTALLLASFRGYEGVVGLLIDNGADATTRNNDGLDALTLAERAGHTELAQMLRTRADENPRVETSQIRPETEATVLFRSNVDCSLTIDGQAMGRLEAKKTLRKALVLGEHIIEAIASDNEESRWEAVLSLDAPTQRVVLIEFSPGASDTSPATLSQDTSSLTPAAVGFVSSSAFLQTSEGQAFQQELRSKYGPASQELEGERQEFKELEARLAKLRPNSDRHRQLSTEVAKRQADLISKIDTFQSAVDQVRDQGRARIDQHARLLMEWAAADGAAENMLLLDLGQATSSFLFVRQELDVTSTLVSNYEKATNQDWARFVFPEPLPGPRITPVLGIDVRTMILESVEGRRRIENLRIESGLGTDLLIRLQDIERRRASLAKYRKQLPSGRAYDDTTQRYNQLGHEESLALGFTKVVDGKALFLNDTSQARARRKSFYAYTEKRDQLFGEMVERSILPDVQKSGVNVVLQLDAPHLIYVDPEIVITRQAIKALNDGRLAPSLDEQFARAGPSVIATLNLPLARGQAIGDDPSLAEVEEFDSFVEQKAAELGIDVLVDASSGIVFYEPPGIDVTDQILALYSAVREE